MNQIELLAPAKDLASGIAAIDAGADAVYIGTQHFGARKNAGNSIEDIQALIAYAHKYWAKVYITVNTILFDNELEIVQKLIHQLYKIGADAIIFQDMAILEMDLPPIKLFASTQTNNYDIERIKFFDKIGVDRIILARELSLEQIKEIRGATNIELEFFVYGALCVSLSGQCYLSQSMSGRSANRGECAQPCRLEYNLVDSQGHTIIHDKHLLSIKDLNLAAHLHQLIKAGITSFKIEGRLKDIYYIKNIVSFFRNQLDSAIDLLGLKKSSSGFSNTTFTPNPEKTFNRNFTDYYLIKEKKKISSFNTPKSTGGFLGKIIKNDNQSILIDTNDVISNGDGLCYFEDGILKGFNVNKVDRNRVFLNESKNIKIGTEIFRNHDIKFNNELDSAKILRLIKVNLMISQDELGLNCWIEDEDATKLSKHYPINAEFANDSHKMINTIITQFSKTGSSIFSINSINIEIDKPYFIPIGKLNEIRRDLLSELELMRLKATPKEITDYRKSTLKYPIKNLNYKFNVVNKLAKQFYGNHGVETINAGYEISPKENIDLMTTKYCIRYEIDDCLLSGKPKYQNPLFLKNHNNKYLLEFDCKNCFMKIKQVTKP